MGLLGLLAVVALGVALALALVPMLVLVELDEVLAESSEPMGSELDNGLLHVFKR